MKFLATRVATPDEMTGPFGAALPERFSAARPDVALSDDELTRFVGVHYERLVRLAGLICHEPEDARDAVQAGLEQAWRRRDSLRDRAALSAWLDRIVVRQAIRLGRRRGPFVRLLHSPREIALDVVDGRADPDPRSIDMRVAFDRLSSEQRAVVVLHLHRGYSMSETADIVGIPLETARSRLRLARERLRRSLSEDRR